MQVFLILIILTIILAMRLWQALSIIEQKIVHTDMYNFYLLM